MALWRKYIVLRTASSIEPKGYVKISADGSSAHIQAKVTGLKGELRLVIAKDGLKHSVPLRSTAGGAEYSGKMEIPSGRILAAVHNTDGKLLAAGESDPPHALWSEFSGLVEKPKQEPKLSRPDFSEFGKKLVMAETGAAAAVHETESKDVLSERVSADTYQPESEVIKPVIEDSSIYQTSQQYSPEAARETSRDEAGTDTRQSEVIQSRQTSRKPVTEMGDEGSAVQKPAEASRTKSSENLSEAKQEEQVQGPGIKETLGKWKWKKVVYRAGTGFYYLTGSVEKNGELLAVAVAVPGEYSKTPPPNLRGFCGFADGYWILAQNAKTGAKLEI